MHTVYIVPAWTDMAGQCHIVAREGSVENPYRDYKENPRLWSEVGLMNSKGKLVCLSATAEAFGEIQSCEPLMAGISFQLEGIIVVQRPIYHRLRAGFHKEGNT